MIVESTVRHPFGGSVVLNVGRNVFNEPIARHHRELLDSLIKSGHCKLIEEDAPPSAMPAAAESPLPIPSPEPELEAAPPRAPEAPSSHVALSEGVKKKRSSSARPRPRPRGE